MPTEGAPSNACKFWRHLVCTKSKYSLVFVLISSCLAYSLIITTLLFILTLKCSLKSGP